ncbi:MAG: hypothetical protein QOI83_3409 [Streptomycetaceae bacterium]|nr:hypothetical protein [Streptomycetaceae bacterium]
MAITVRELLETPHLRLSLLAGARGLERRISWAHTSDLPNPWEWLSAGELLLTNGTGLPADAAAQAAFVEALAEGGTSALIVGLGTGGPPLTRTLTERADELSLPVLTGSYSMPFTAVIRAVADANEREESLQVVRVARLYELLRGAVTAGLPGPEMLRLLGRELGVRLYLVDPETGLSLFDDGVETGFGDALVTSFAAHGRAIPGVLRLCRTGGTDEVAEVVAVPGDQATALVAESVRGRLPSLVLLQHVATVGALALAQLAAGRERRRRLGAELLVRLLDRRIDPVAAERQLAEAEVELAGSVLVVGRATADGAEDRVHHRLARLRVPHLLLSRDETLHIVVADQPDHLDPLAQLLESSSAVGISGRIGTPERLPEAGQEARWALGAAEAEERRLIRYGNETALLLPRTPTEAQSLVSRVLGPLVDHDAERGTDYLRTLRTVLVRNRSWQLAAEDLHIHKQTLGYRLRKIEQLTGRGLNRTEHIAELWFAVRAHDLLCGRSLRQR